MVRTRIVGCLLLASVGAACDGIDLLNTHPSLIDGAFETDSTAYHVRTTDASHQVTIGATFRNHSAVEVLISTCHSPHPPALEKLGPDGWVTVYSPVVLLCLGPPVRIAPGDDYRITYHVAGTRLPNAAPRLEVDEIPGTYRLNWYALHTKSGGQLPAAQRTSNPFELLEADPDA